MSRIVKYIAYSALFLFFYFIFLYWVFPYDALKDRLLTQVERQLGEGVQVTAKHLEPYWFTGVTVTGLTVEGPSATGTVELANIKRARARASLISLLLGRVSLSFDISIGKGGISGDAVIGDDAISLDVEANNLDISSIAFLDALTGIKFASKIDGEAVLQIDKQQPVRSTGNISLSLDSLRILASTIKAGGMDLVLPDLDLAKGRDSQIKISVGKGVANIDNFRFANGDLFLDLKGKIFLSNKFENFRLNLNGAFGASEKLNQALPFFFIIDSQKQEDGTYPLSLTGRIAKPAIKVGTFTVPL